MDNQNPNTSIATPQVKKINPVHLARTGAPDTSHEAARSVNTSKLEKMVYGSVCRFGDSGCIQDDILEVFHGYPYSSITARFRSLLDKGLIIDTGARRPGRSGRNQRVLRRSVV